LNSEKVAALIEKLNSDPQFVLAQNVGTTHDLLDICLKRATVQGAQHVFQHVVPQEGKPVTNQKSSGEVLNFLHVSLDLPGTSHVGVLRMALRGQRFCTERTCRRIVGVAQAVEHLLRKGKPLSLNPSPTNNNNKEERVVNS
jgi:hypothetical protein